MRQPKRDRGLVYDAEAAGLRLRGADFPIVASVLAFDTAIVGKQPRVKVVTNQHTSTL